MIPKGMLSGTRAMSLAIALLAGAVAVTLITAWMHAAVGGMEFVENRLTERVIVLQHAPWLETMTAIDAGPALIIVDTWGSLEAARQAKTRIDSLFHKPVRFVVNTHHHWDHTFGNAAFRGARIVGHLFCVQDMKADYTDAGKRKAHFEKSAASEKYASLRQYMGDVGKETSGEEFRLDPPDQSVGKREKLTIGDVSILLYHTPGIHTRSNLTIFIPELGILFGRREFADPGKITLEAGADPQVIAQVLSEILACGKPVRYLIPGHGDAIGDPDLKPAIERLKKMNAGAAVRLNPELKKHS